MSLARGFSRRDFLAFSGAAIVAPMLPHDALASLATETPLHGISSFGELKYGPQFSHFDYATPDAPKGGTFNFSPFTWAFNQSVETFNTLNCFVGRGDAPPRMEMCFDTLMVRALDEPDAMYGLLAQSVTISEDKNSFTFQLRKEARWHDGTPLTAHDAAFTFDLFKRDGHPALLLPLSEMTEAKALDDHAFRVTFSGKQSSRILLTIAGYPIVSKAYFSENPFDASQLKASLGSGPYRVGRYAAGQYIEYNRVDDYWGRDLPVNRGFYHFDKLRIEFFRDRQAGFEAFKKGDIHYRQEATSRIWATGYDFPAISQGKVVKREFASELMPSMQAWALNQRRTRFKDQRVRRAVGLCFDFEWTNRNLFYGIYNRSHSTFEKSEFKTEGLPSPEEFAILEKFRDHLPDEVFGEVYVQPSSDGSGRARNLLRQARQLLEQADFVVRGNFLHHKDTGERLTLESLVQDEGFVRIETPFIDNLRAIGVDASIRIVDPSQYQARQRDFDYDMIGMAMRFSAMPSRDSLFDIFHSRTADIPSSRNLTGTKDPVIDELIEMAGSAETREDLTIILRVLDRVLRARFDWIPNWHSANHLVSYWDKFGFKEPKPDYGFPIETLWWHDETKAKAIERN